MLIPRCGSTVGIYFDIKRSFILYLFTGSGSFGQTPYLDAYGEMDITMR